MTRGTRRQGDKATGREKTGRAYSNDEMSVWLLLPEPKGADAGALSTGARYSDRESRRLLSALRIILKIVVSKSQSYIVRKRSSLTGFT
jgi:hypothetical protein